MCVCVCVSFKHFKKQTSKHKWPNNEAKQRVKIKERTLNNNNNNVVFGALPMKC